MDGGRRSISEELRDDESQPQPSRRADVYERLYDRRSYTGVYRKRFELEIHDLTDTVVHDLSSTIRPNLNYSVTPKQQKRAVSPRLSISSSTPASITIEPPPPSPSPEKPPCPSPIQLKGDPNDPHTLLKAVFHYYCRFGRTGAKGVNEKTMNNVNFSKLCRECPDLLSADFTTTDVDLIFVKAKKKGERRINYTQFLDALGMLALEKYPETPLEKSLPKVLQVHLARLPPIVELTDGRMRNAVWQRRRSSGSRPPSPRTPQRRASVTQTSPPRVHFPHPTPSHSPLRRRQSAPSSVMSNSGLARQFINGLPKLRSFTSFDTDALASPTPTSFDDLPYTEESITEVTL
ncbi:hypothetical protein Poli38472_009126 [Pythium oligandrum]|uniref:Uncharacterized protein n=1 Tax=Pythium oligandrum TaxID=41045 RepID=A0A8K1CK01_PYTOL|nr:hypothetical protein Poli38472_009126 [Pythium oligandrum]|eukprot:TMW64959.1 hypothetical protein Poli38472_009126 [Pythium oligandrum]